MTGGKRCAAIAIACTTMAAPAGATQYIGTHPPTAAQRRGLVRAFRVRHPARSKVRLVGFRLFEKDPNAAAYYLLPGRSGSYAAAHTELYSRRGSRWVHVKRFKMINPDFSDAYALTPGFLWKVTSAGTGTWDSSDTNTSDDDTTTSSVHAAFRWSEAFRGGHALQLSDGEYYTAAPNLTGTYTASTTDSLDPSSNGSCSGTVTGTSHIDHPGFSFALDPEYGTTRALDYTIDLSPGLNWTSCALEPSFPEADRLVVGARIPVDPAELAGIYASGGLHPKRLVMSAHAFTTAVTDTAPPSVKKAAEPHTSAHDGADSSTEDLELSGTLHFVLAGLYMPLGLLGDPHPPVREDGHHVPPVL